MINAKNPPGAWRPMNKQSIYRTGTLKRKRLANLHKEIENLLPSGALDVAKIAEESERSGLKALAGKVGRVL